MEARFDEPELTSDAGLAALVSSGIADEVIASLAAAMDDPRKNPEHSGEQLLLAQRIFQIIGGYYDANDSDQLRDDMVMRTAAGKSLEQEDWQVSRQSPASKDARARKTCCAWRACSSMITSTASTAKFRK
ncbi:MAG: transposase [Verrucomicrobiales bacterium]